MSTTMPSTNGRGAATLAHGDIKTAPATVASQAERVVAAACLSHRVNAAERDEMLRVVSPEMFNDGVPGRMVAAVARLRSQGQLVDLESVLDEMTAHGCRRAEEEVKRILRGVSPEAVGNVQAHARRVRDAAARRRALLELRKCATALGAHDVSLGGAVRGLKHGLGGLESAGDESVKVLTLADILADPEAMQVPTPVVPHYAWPGRVTLAPAPEKTGKSTSATAQLAVKSSGGTYLGETVSQGHALYVNLEEHLGDVARRMVRFGATPDRVHILDRVSDPVLDLETAIRRSEAELVVVDTLAAFTSPLDLDPYNSAHWVGVMGQVTRVARDTNAAVILLHHARKAGGYRDSTAIGAGVDQIITMTVGVSADERVCESVGRMGMETFRMRLTPTAQGGLEYSLVPPSTPSAPRDTERGLQQRILEFVASRPGCSATDVTKGVSGRKETVLAAVHALVSAGRLINDGGSGAMQLRVAD